MRSLNWRLLILTFSAVFIEVSVCVWGFATNKALWSIPFLLSAYHGGYILSRLKWLARLYPRAYGVTLDLTLLCLVIGIALDKFWIVFIGLLGTSSLLHAMRRLLKPQARPSSAAKNIAKSLAMLLSGTAALPLPGFPIALLGLVILIQTSSPNSLPLGTNVESRSYGAGRSPLLIFELLHHAHYFAYCYTFWALLKPVPALSLGLFFLVGWLGYYMLEAYLREHLQIYDGRWIVIGHIICAVSLVAMLWLKSTASILTLWFITGIGGGTAYMLGNIHYSGNRELFEDVGHLVGCFTAALAVLITSRVEGTIIIAAGYAFTSTFFVSPAPWIPRHSRNTTG